MAHICLVTDSTSDLPDELVARYHIHVVPAILTIAGKSYRDGVDITRTQYYDMLPALPNLPQTASPSAGEFGAVYERCAPHARILSLHAAATLSGIYNSARLASAALGERITVVDSGSLSMGLGWQVLAAAEAIARGEPLRAILAAIADVRRRLHVFALLDTLEFLRRGGRVSLFRAGLGSLLQIKPIVELCEGEVRTIVQERTRRRAFDRLVALVRGLGPLDRLAIMHTNFVEAAAALREALAGAATAEPVIVDATTVIGAHVGPRALGVAAVTATQDDNIEM
ncbi:MAG: DegV family protein [Anaerolineales bacterium]